MHPHHFEHDIVLLTKGVNSEIIFVPISEYDFGYYVVNHIKFHFWLNAYFEKELH